MRKNRRSGYPIYALCVASVMTALCVLFTRVLAFPPGGESAYRFDFGFLPICIAAELLGPYWSAASYLIADIIGALVSGYAPNIWISFCKMLTGLCLGVFMYRKYYKLMPTVTRTVISFSFIAVLVDFVMMSPAMMYIYGLNAGAAFSARAINAAVNLPIRIITYILIRPSLDKPMRHINKTIPTVTRTEFKTFANSFQAVTIPGLERISLLCSKLGDPQSRLRFIHVAGTNGKGSVCANIASILEVSGYRVGKYISPNLIRVNERISINGEDISDEDMNEILSRIEPLAKEVERELGIAPTQFEIWTALAFVYFFERRCDYVVLEVGLGGEFDATNVISSNVMAVITRLGLDHTSYLGNTITEIAAAKCGIMKHSCETGSLITVAQEDEAMAVIRERVEKFGQQLLLTKPIPTSNDGAFERFTLYGVEYKAGIAGYHQIENAALAVRAALTLGISVDNIKEGLSRAKNPARFELVSENPTVIYDGGHNENGIEALNFSLSRYFPSAPKTVIFACMADKEIKRSLELLSRGETEFIFTTVKNNPRAMTASELRERALSLGFEGVAYDEIGDAYRDAVSRGKLTVICGSLYLYSDFRNFYDNM